MSTTLPQATASAHYATIAGVRLRLRVLRDKDFGEFLAFLQDLQIATVKRNIKDLAPEQQDKLLARAMDKANALHMGSMETLALMASPVGVAMLLWLSVRRDHADLTWKEIDETGELIATHHGEDAMGAMIGTVDAFAAAASAIDKIVPTKRAVKRKGGGPAKRATKKEIRRSRKRK